jgi:hypothetical protein
VARLDTANALIVGGAALVYPFERRWQPGNSPAEDRVIARWTDGGVAATERRAGAGCIRDVAIPVARSGDLVLRRDFGRMLRSLTAPCRMAGVDQPVAAVDSALFAGSGSLAATSTIRPSESAATPLVPWLLAIAVVLSLLELALRRRGTALSLEAEG